VSPFLSPYFHFHITTIQDKRAERGNLPAKWCFSSKPPHLPTSPTQAEVSLTSSFTVPLLHGTSGLVVGVSLRTICTACFLPDVYSRTTLWRFRVSRSAACSTTIYSAWPFLPARNVITFRAVRSGWICKKFLAWIYVIFILYFCSWRDSSVARPRRSYNKKLISVQIFHARETKGINIAWYN
jgi:hypothetical protein